MTESLLSIRKLSKRFSNIIAADNIDLDVSKREIHGIIGSNGSGKTTLIRQITGEVKPDSGSVYFAGQDVAHMSVAKRVRAGLGCCYQIASRFNGFNTEENVMFGLLAQPNYATPSWKFVHRDRKLLTQSNELLVRFGLQDRGSISPNLLSYGEQRQLEIAIALSTGPTLLLMDEPLAGLGLMESMAMIKQISELKKYLAILLVEHDLNAIFTLSDRVTLLENGRVLASGTPTAISKILDSNNRVV